MAYLMTAPKRKEAPRNLTTYATSSESFWEEEEEEVPSSEEDLTATLLRVRVCSVLNVFGVGCGALRPQTRGEEIRREIIL